MKDIVDIVLLREASIDLEQGRKFYNKLQMGVGDYFYDSLISDIESLYLYAGIHPCHGGYHYMPSHRFPFAVYYEINNSTVIVVAVLDMRRNPTWLHNQLGERKK